MRKTALYLLLVAVLSLFSLQLLAQDDTDAPALEVTSTLPAADSVNVETTTEITVIFNRPVVPLVTLAEAENLPDPLTFFPPVEGEGEWVNTSIYTFTPAVALAGGENYAVVVDENLTSVDGVTFAEPFGFTFTTLAPQVFEALPPNDPDGLGTRVDLNRMIQFRFNQPVDQASFETNFYLNVGDAPLPIDGTFEWADDGMGVSYTPADFFALDTTYTYGFPEGVVSAAVGSATLPAFSSTFWTIGEPAIVGTSPFDGEQDAQPYGGIELYFATPMDPETLPDKIAITPAPDNIDYYWREWDNTYSVQFPFQPSTSYTVDIAPGMADVYGNTIDTPLTFSFTTARAQPEVNLQVPSGPVGFYDGDREATELFVAHRNVSQLDLRLYDISTQSFVDQLNSNSYYSLSREYVPDSTQLLRSWSVPSVADPDTFRYELIDLGNADGSGSVGSVPGAIPDCPGTIPPRAKVGDRAEVILDPDPLRARAFPPDGEIVELLYRGYAFNIVGGPVCENSLLWWEIELRDGSTAWAAEGVGDEYFFEVTNPGQQTQVTIPQDVLPGGSLPFGVYYLNVTSPETQQAGYSDRTHFMVVGNANLTVKSSIDSAVVWATDVHSGLGLPGVQVTLNIPGQAPLVATTDIDGVTRFNFERRADLYTPMTAVIDDGQNFGIGFSEWSEGIDAWRFNLRYDSYPTQYSFYLHTDRPVYRPGQTVYFRGVVREKDDVTYTVPEIAELPVTVFDNQGTEIYSTTLSLTPYGTFSDSFELADGAGIGFYRIEVVAPSSNPSQREVGGINFDVAEYRLPEFQVTVNSDRDEVIQGDTVNVEIDTRFFFGGPVTQANVTYSVSTTDHFFNYEGDDGYYDFYDYNTDTGDEFRSSSFGNVIIDGSGTTDNNGKLIIEVPASYEQATQSQQFVVEATVSDSSNQAVSGRDSFIVHQGEFYIGVRPESYVSSAGMDTNVEVITVDWDSNTVSQDALEYSIIERRWTSIQTVNRVNGMIEYDYELEEIPVDSGSISTDENGKALITFVPPNGGVYKATISGVDASDNTVQSSTTMWVSDSNFVSWRQPNNNRIDLIANAEEYAVGDVAEILITSPFMGNAEALVTVERGDILSTSRATLTSNSTIYRIPIDDNSSPNIFVSVFIVKGVDENQPVASFRMGIINLQVDTERRVLTIDLEPDRDLVGPRETVTYTVTTTDYTGAGVPAEVGLSLTDLAALSIAPANSGPILEAFFGEQPLGVRTTSPLTINTDEVTQYTQDVIKGGGGGGGGYYGVFEIREEFVDTPYWNATFTTNEDGTGSFEVTLPDNLTTWRLDARGVTSGENVPFLVGQETEDIVSTKPVLIRPATPRFFVVGDNVELGAIVNNNTPDDLEVVVSIQGNGLTFESDLEQTVTVPANGSTRVDWNVVVDNVENVELIFFADANNGEYTDATRPQVGQGDDRLLPVYKYEAPETVGTGGVLREADTRVEEIALPENSDITQGELTVNVNTSLAANTVEALDVLERYPYQSTVTTIDRMFTNAVTKNALVSLGVDNQGLSDALDREVNIALQRLAAEQKFDGGWGWYFNDESDELVTAYGALAILEASEAGYSVSPEMLIDSLNFVDDRYDSVGNNNRRAMMLYALARGGMASDARLNILFEARQGLDLYAKALLALSIRDETDQRVVTLRNELLNAAIISANGAHWEEARGDSFNWNTDTRSTAIILKALVELDSGNDLLPNVVRWLMVARTADAWETTQETAWSVSALTDWMVTTNELNGNYDYSVALNDETLTEGTASQETALETEKLIVAITDLLTDQANSLTVTRGEGDGALYYTAYLRAFLPVPEIDAVNRGIVVQRYYTLSNSEEPITSAQVGDIIDVHLTVIAPNQLNYVVVDDHLFAGAESIDPGLSTSQQVDTGYYGYYVEEDTETDPLLYGWGWYIFTNIEFRDERTVLTSPYLPAGTYEYKYSARLTSEGEFNVIPPYVSETYFPEVFGRGNGSLFTVLPAEE